MFKALDPLLHSELRLAIVSLLAGVECADFSYIKEATGATAGNISVQFEKLSSAGYISIAKGFNGKKPQTVCTLTEVGKQALADYVEALKSYLPI